MNWARRETVKTLFEAACEMEVVDCHTHVQDDLIEFDEAAAKQNLAGTQAAMNRYPEHLVAAAARKGRLVRRTMMDVAHGCFYSWFAQVVEGRRGKLDAIIATLGDNRAQDRAAAGRMLIEELQDARFSEYAEWLRVMFRFYDGVGDWDPLDPTRFDEVQSAVAAQRNDPEFAKKILRDHRIAGYVTSIENRDRIPWASAVRPEDVDLSYATHPEAYHMFDANYLVWPEGATDFGLFTAGHKYESEQFLIYLEAMTGRSIQCLAQLKEGLREWLMKILYSPLSNPTSRVRYTDLYHPMDYRFGEPYDSARVNAAIRFRKASIRGDDLRQVCSVVTEAMLETLHDIGGEMKAQGSEHGACLQVAMGVAYFMDPSREIQSYPLYAAGVAQDEYPVWRQYSNIHFEYIIAHDQLYEDMANAAKQTGNVSVGPWWHFFRTHKIAKMMHDQLSMGPVSAIASGFTDARFVEMLAAKYQSVRKATALALAEFVDDPASSMRMDDAFRIMNEILYQNPIQRHHLPIAIEG